MSYLVIVVAVLVMISVLTSFKPSARQKRLVILRRYANERGLHIEIVADAVTDQRGSSPTAVRYLLPWTAKNIRHDDQRHWLLVRGKRGRLSPWEGWCWFQQEAPEDCHGSIRRALDKMPSSVNAICSNSFGLGAYWPEKGKIDEIDKIAAGLRIISSNKNTE
ncbi:MAG: hypothetical protein JKX92_06410 [Porticoccaceae bacterium]|nr:hypothetical protein [Porticoccaceae bacterium]